MKWHRTSPFAGELKDLGWEHFFYRAFTLSNRRKAIPCIMNPPFRSEDTNCRNETLIFLILPHFQYEQIKRKLRAAEILKKNLPNFVKNLHMPLKLLKVFPLVFEKRKSPPVLWCYQWLMICLVKLLILLCNLIHITHRTCYAGTFQADLTSVTIWQVEYLFVTLWVTAGLLVLLLVPLGDTFTFTSQSPLIVYHRLKLVRWRDPGWPPCGSEHKHLLFIDKGE